MDLDLSEEQEMLREMVRGVCSSYSSTETVRAMEDDPVGFPPELWKQMAELDLIGLMLPSEYGGSDMGNLGGVEAEPIPWGGQPFSAEFTLPPLSGLWLVPADE